MGYLLVAIGGAFGSTARFVIGRKLAEKTVSRFPIGTFFVNITGAFLLGALSSAGLEQHLYLLFCEGFLGAFTTFSTLMYEDFNLFQDNEKRNAVVYILSSLILGLIGFSAGFEIGKFI